MRPNRPPISLDVSRDREAVGVSSDASARPGKPKRKAITDKMKMDVLRCVAITTVQCPLCFTPTPLKRIQFDHIQALIDGGAHDVMNLRAICDVCHKPKSAFEHTRNSKHKRLAVARAVHDAVKRGEHVRPASRIKGRGFPKVHRPMRRPQP